MHEGTYALIYQWKNQWNTFVLLHYCFFTSASSLPLCCFHHDFFT
jgi:hypothetical protein